MDLSSGSDPELSVYSDPRGQKPEKKKGHRSWRKWEWRRKNRGKKYYIL